MEKKQKENVIKAYKGFDDKLQCIGFQYEVGKEYKMTGEISCCRNGFHACQSPLEVLDYYFLLNDGKMARFCEVEQAGTIDKKDDGSTKVASSKIKINRELTFSELISLGIEWLEKKVKYKKSKDSKLSDNGERHAKIVSGDNYVSILSNGNDAQIGSSGDKVQITNSGYFAKIGTNGNDVKIASSGYSATIGSSGNGTTIGISGNDAKIGSSGNYAKIASSGDNSKIGSSGDDAYIASSGGHANIGSSGAFAYIGSSGKHAKIGSSGDDAKIGSSGYSAQIDSSGDDAYIASSGHGTKIASIGDCAKIGSSGNYTKIMSSGEDSVISCVGHNSIAQAKKGSWITLAEWVEDEKKNRWVPKCVKTEYVDGERIKGDTWYELIDGEFTEVDV